MNGITYWHGSGVDAETVAETQAHQPDDETDCDFNGDVDVRYEGTVGAWECPCCGEILEATR